MSSPFATFRKNRQFWMAALVLLAILAFVVAPAIETATQSFRGGNEEAKAVFVSWDGGRMTRGEVEQAMAKRNQLILFLRALSKRVIEKGGEPAVPGFSRWQTGEIRSLGIDEDVSAQRICLGRIVATHANRLGIQFDDNAADEFLRSFINGRIGDQEFNELLKSSAGGLTIYDIRELLKQELTVLVAQSLAGGTSTARPPGKTWRDFLKLNQTTKVEAFPVFVSEFLSKVSGTPSESEIQEIFEEGKNLLPNPDSETAGFMRPDLADVEFIESKFQNWIDREKEQLTEDDIRAEYDRLVTLGQLKVPVTDEPEEPAAQPPDSEPPEADSDEEEPSTGEPSSVDTPQSDEPASEQPDSDLQPDTSEPDTTEPGTTEPDATEPDATEPDGTEPSPQEPAAEEPAPESEPDLLLSRSEADSATSLRSGSIRSTLIETGHLVSAIQESDEPVADEQPDSTPQSGSADEAAAAGVSDELPVESSDGVVLGILDEDMDATPQPEDELAGDESAVAELPDQVEEPQMRTQSFEEAREEVAFQLARSRAVAVADEVLTELNQKMREYNLAFRQYQSFRAADMDDAELPIRPDLKELAAKYGLVHGQTGMSDRFRLASTNFGRSSVFLENRPVGSAADVATSPQLELFTPMQSGYAGPDPTEFYQYLFWKVDAQPAAVPELNEVRDAVIEAWKTIQARDLAEEEANRIAGKVGASDQDDPWESALSETLRTLVVTTDPFSWLSRMGMQVTPTTVPKLDGVGEEFMRRTFSAEIGDTVVAPNRAKSVYYVARVLEKAPDLDELQERFDADQFKQGPSAVADLEIGDEANIWVSRVFSDLNVQFLD